MPEAFVFDTAMCTGCQACQLACTIENDLEPDQSWRQIYTFNEGHLAGAPLFHLSLACNHCADPVCATACPALAYTRDEATGAVLIDERRCVGCGYCAWACPYEAPRYDVQRRLMTKCTWCHDRLARGLMPACAELCPTGALTYAHVPYEDLVDAANSPPEGFPASDIGPAIRIVPLPEGARGPRISIEEAPPPARLVGAASMWPAGDHADPGPASVVSGSGRGPLASPSGFRTGHIALRDEWPLAIFSILTAVLFAIVAAAAAPVMGPVTGAAARPGVFLLLAAVAIVAGATHLGRPLRAWRVVLNLFRSPLSLEIFTLSSFVAVGATCLWRLPVGAAAGAGAILCGLIALASVDRVYRYTRWPGHPNPHSSSVLLTGVYLAGIAVADPVVAAATASGSTGSPVSIWATVAFSMGAAVAGFAGTVKLILYLSRGATPPTLAVARVAIGLVLPAALWIVTTLALATTSAVFPGGHAGLHATMLLAALIGEALDRAQFYDELELVSPRRRMRLDLERRFAPPGGEPA